MQPLVAPYLLMRDTEPNTWERLTGGEFGCSRDWEHEVVVVDCGRGGSADSWYRGRREVLEGMAQGVGVCW